MDQEFIMPRLYTGCLVECAAGKTFSSDKAVLGLVLRAKTRSADILAISAKEFAPLIDCWHVDDPRVQASGPDAWDNNNRGTFRLAESEIRARRLEEDFLNLARQFSELRRSAIGERLEVAQQAVRATEQRLEEIEERVEALEANAAQPRTVARGRWHKPRGSDTVSKEEVAEVAALLNSQ